MKPNRLIQGVPRKPSDSMKFGEGRQQWRVLRNVIVSTRHYIPCSTSCASHVQFELSFLCEGGWFGLKTLKKRLKKLFY